MIDWRLVVLQLRKHYGPCERISRAIGRHKGWAGQLARGEIAEPAFSDGLRLLDLAYDHVPLAALKAARRTA